MGFAENLKAARKEQNISQEDLANILNVSRQAVSKWEQGMGYPEVEKLLILSKKLNISLDSLMNGEPYPKEAQEKYVVAVTGKISIMSQDGNIVTCYKVLTFPVSKAKNAPKYALFGVDGRSFLDENRVFLGWYANQDAITQETEAIMRALESGQATYRLQHTVKVKKKLLNIEIDE